MTGPDGALWLTGGTQRPAVVRVDPLGAVTEFSAGLSPYNGLLGPIVAGAGGNLWFTARGQSHGGADGGTMAIGRVTPNGEITEYGNCLHRGPPFTGPEAIVAGPDGNVWFTSVTTRSLPNIGTPPAIGRITPSGEITEFRAGIGGEPDTILAGPDGRIWFGGGESESVERIAPSSEPVNTFLIERSRRASSTGVARVPVSIPGPGRLKVEQLALLLPGHRQRRIPHITAAAAAASCGRPLLRVKAVGVAKERFRATGSARIKVRITFTSDGGSPYTRTATVLVYR